MEFAVGSLLIAAVSFLLGRVFNQSELVLAEKRRVYEEFLSVCPRPNEAYKDWEDDDQASLEQRLAAVTGKTMLYASPNVAKAIEVYITKYVDAVDELNPDSEALHPAFKLLARAHNDIILEMRRDALGWSIFGHRGKSRLPD